MRRSLRLRRSVDFAQVRKAGRRYRHPLLSLAVFANGTIGNRYGFVVSRALGGAVSRNRVKRRLRSLMRHFHEWLRPGYDIVLIARPRLIGQPYADLQRIIAGMLARARLLEGA